MWLLYLGRETDIDGNEIYSIDLVFENVCNVKMPDKSGTIHMIDRIMEVQLIMDENTKKDLYFKVGSIVGVTGRLYKTTTEVVRREIL